MNPKVQLYFSFFIFSFSFNVMATCEPNIIASTPSTDFTIHGDGTVTHNKTNLMWKVCPEGETWSSAGCDGEVELYTWKDALQVSKTLNENIGYANNTDWRLPNIKELISIVEYQCYAPAVNTNIFPSVTSGFWTSTPLLGDSSPLARVWEVDFYYGKSLSVATDSLKQVLLVREAQ